MHSHGVDRHLPGFLIHPEINVVVLIRRSCPAEVGAGKVFPVLLELAHRLMDANEVERDLLCRLFVLQLVASVTLGARSCDVLVKRAHDFPAPLHLRFPRMLGRRNPPLRLGLAGDLRPLIPFLARRLVDADIDNAQPPFFRFHPEIYLIFFLGFLAVRKDDVREKPIAMQSSHKIDCDKFE